MNQILNTDLKSSIHNCNSFEKKHFIAEKNTIKKNHFMYNLFCQLFLYLSFFLYICIVNFC